MFITHDLNEAMFLGDRIAILKDGQMEQIGTAEEILRNPATEYVAAFVHAGRSFARAHSQFDHEGACGGPSCVGGPSAALKAMSEKQVSALHLTSTGRRLLGLWSTLTR